MKYKGLFLAIAFTAGVCINASSQDSQGKPKISSVGSMMGLPAYIIADNSSPAVIISFREFLPQKTNNYDPNSSYAPKDVAEIYNLSPKIFELLVKYLKEDLAKTPIKPSVFINLGEERANAGNNEVKADNKIRKKIFESKSFYTINLVVSKYPKEERIRMDSASRSDFGHMVININRYRGGSVLFPDPEEFGYMLYINNYDEFVSTLNKKIGKTDHYRTHLEHTDTSKVFREIKEFETVPDDLDKFGIAVLKSGGSMFFDQEMDDKLEKRLQKNYKFQYKFIDRMELPMLARMGYKYVLEYKAIPYKLARKDVKNTNTVTEEEKQEVYYIIRDLKTDDLFYCASIDEVKNNDTNDPVKAMDMVLERINKYYKNKKK